MNAASVKGINASRILDTSVFQMQAKSYSSAKLGNGPRI